MGWSVSKLSTVLVSKLGGNYFLCIYLEYHSVCPLVRIGTPPFLLSPQASLSRPQEPKGGGTHSPAGEWEGGPILDDWREKSMYCINISFFVNFCLCKTMPEVSFQSQADRGVVGTFGKINYRTLGLYTYEYVDNCMLYLRRSYCLCPREY